MIAVFLIFKGVFLIIGAIIAIYKSKDFISEIFCVLILSVIVPLDIFMGLVELDKKNGVENVQEQIQK